MQDLCHATPCVRTSSNPTGAIFISFSTFKCLGLYFFMCFVCVCVCVCVLFFYLFFCCCFCNVFLGCVVVVVLLMLIFC